MLESHYGYIKNLQKLKTDLKDAFTPESFEWVRLSYDEREYLNLRVSYLPPWCVGMLVMWDFHSMTL